MLTPPSAVFNTMLFCVRYPNGTNGYAYFRVSLRVGSREFFGEAATAQAAKHDAATNALKILKVSRFPSSLEPFP